MIMAKKEQPGGDFLVKTEDRMPAEQIARAQDEMYKAIDLAEADLFNLLKQNRASVLKLDPGEKQKYIRNILSLIKLNLINNNHPRLRL